jgi:hypothetical protein
MVIELIPLLALPAVTACARRFYGREARHPIDVSSCGDDGNVWNRSAMSPHIRTGTRLHATRHLVFAHALDAASTLPDRSSGFKWMGPQCSMPTRLVILKCYRNVFDRRYFWKEGRYRHLSHRSTCFCVELPIIPISLYPSMVVFVFAYRKIGTTMFLAEFTASVTLKPSKTDSLSPS